MASKTHASAALFLALNLVFFAMVTACGTCPNPPKHKPKPKPSPKPTPIPKPTPTTPTLPTPIPKPTPTTPTTPTPGTPSPKDKCPTDTLKLGVCADLLGLVNVVLGSPPTLPCCSLIQGLTDLEAAVCLCTALKANVLGINLNVPISLSLLLNTCGKKSPSSFKCS